MASPNARSEEAQEASNEDTKRFRENNPRKTSRKHIRWKIYLITIAHFIRSTHFESKKN